MMKNLSKNIVGGGVLVLSILVSNEVQAKSLFGKDAKKQLKEYLTEICDWIESSDIGGQEGGFGLPEARLFRTLLAGYELLGKDQRYLLAAIRWCDLLAQKQEALQPSQRNVGAIWVKGNDGEPMDLAESSFVAAALAQGWQYADKRRKKIFLKVLERYARILTEGFKEDPLGNDQRGSEGWVIQEGSNKGAIGKGFLGNQSIIYPSTASTAAGSVLFAQLYKVTNKRSYRQLAADAIRWLIKSRRLNGEIPAIVEGAMVPGDTLKVIPHCTEAFQAATYLLNDTDLTSWMLVELDPTVRWFVRSQNGRGLWGEGSEQAVTANIIMFLAWFYLNAETDESIPPLLNPAWKLWLNPVHAQSFGILMEKPVTGRIGLATAEMLKPGSTFRKK